MILTTVNKINMRILILLLFSATSIFSQSLMLAGGAAAEIPPTDIVSNGLQSYVDANDVNSYSGTGSVWYDLSGNSQDWDISSATYQNALNPAYFSLNGTSNNINSQNGLLPGTEWTIGLWAKQSVKGDWFISDYDRYSPYDGYILSSSGTTGYLQLGGRDGGSYSIFASTSVDVSDNTWRYITITRNGNSYKIYINGSLQGSGSGVNASFTTNDKFYIGSRVNNTFYYEVDVGEVHMYTRELAASEVQQNYTVTKDKY